MRVLNTQAQFMVQLNVRTPDSFDAVNTHCVVGVIALIEASSGYHLYGWGPLFRASNLIDNFFSTQIVRLYTLNQLRPETVALVEDSLLPLTSAPETNEERHIINIDEATNCQQ